jgi:hypothetical protein
VRERTLSSEVAFLDIFFRVIPRTAARGHGNCGRKAR